MICSLQLFDAREHAQPSTLEQWLCFILMSHLRFCDIFVIYYPPNFDMKLSQAENIRN